MAKKLSPDGVPIDIPSITRKKRPLTTLFDDILPVPKDDPGPEVSEEAPTAERRAAPAAEMHPDDLATKPAGLPGGLPPAIRPPRSDDPRTVIAGGGLRHRQGQLLNETAQGSTQAKPSPSTDPVVGWLVIVQGPGLGASLRLGMGQNTIGRGADARVRLDYGDMQISRSNHASVTYDHRGDTFYVQPGNGVNLTYLEDDPVLGATPLPNRARITIGETTLRFVALCDGSFSWNEREEG